MMPNVAKSGAQRQREYRRRRRDRYEERLRAAWHKPANWHPDARTWGWMGNRKKRQKPEHVRDHQPGEFPEWCSWCAAQRIRGDAFTAWTRTDSEERRASWLEYLSSVEERSDG